ncbi:MAG TPA: hypothetical protein VMU69_30095 [Bradyrhizobium sp.]|nr:hypothetical protein [Bradyrhizobium sp.]
MTVADLLDKAFITRPRRDRCQDASRTLVSRGIKIHSRPLGTAAVKLMQVADMEFFRTYVLLWSRDRENGLKEFITFTEHHDCTP